MTFSVAVAVVVGVAAAVAVAVAAGNGDGDVNSCDCGLDSCELGILSVDSTSPESRGNSKADVKDGGRVDSSK